MYRDRATHASHGPREVPTATLDKFEFIDWTARRTYHALTSHLDELVGKMVQTLHTAHIWEKTLIGRHKYNHQISLLWVTWGRSLNCPRGATLWGKW